MQEPKENPIEIQCGKEDTTELELKLGDQFSFKYHRHFSVGIDFEFEVEDTHLVEQVVSEHEYLHPEKLKPGWTGGDKERCRWVFQTIKHGCTTLTIRKMFRGNVEHTCVFQIAIEGRE